ncbi:MAG: YdcH family protein [Desulfarculales bacterium]|jgi:uncharacterized protein YdcH (DUF465 family)|nr:YdcH family protein [Desulfarculales bacterium]
MESNEIKLIEELIPHNEELKKLWNEHLTLNGKLDAMANQHYFTAEEQLERKQMQKRKLAGRDRIYEILESHRAA